MVGVREIALAERDTGEAVSAYKMSTDAPNYRPDIDGLRALAVLAVILYHLDIPALAGGFVGVDVFFVISGFLITRIIRSEVAEGRFTFASFYERRARRLLPALFATTAATFVVSAFLFLPEDLERAARSAIATVLGLSNLHFWMESGYFDVAATLKPLLHTWSLAVELQFYLVWPALVVLLIRINQLAIGVILAIAIGTVACLFAMSADPTAAFFLTPFRFGEFAIGGAAALVDGRLAKRGFVAELFYLAGLAGISFSALSFNETTAFPGLAALIPASGTALAIVGGQSVASRVLRLPPIVWLGKISYSLYLVHWPLIVFSLYVLDGRRFTYMERGLLLVVTIVLAAGSYYFVERPFRRRPAGSSGKAALAGIVAAAAVIIIPAGHAWSTGGWGWRFPTDLTAILEPDAAAHREYIWANQVARTAPRFTTGRPHFLVVGDSQAADLTNVLLEAGYGQKVEIVSRIVFAECGFPYLPSEAAGTFWTTENTYTMRDPGMKGSCGAQYQFMTSGIVEEADVVLVAYSWSEDTLRFVPSFMAELDKRAKNVLVVGSKLFSSSPAEMVRRNNNSITGLDRVAYELRSPKALRINAALTELLGSRFFDPLSRLCPAANTCHALTDTHEPTLYGENHLTEPGAKFLARIGVAQEIMTLMR